MEKKLSTLVAVSALALGLSACATTWPAPGKYEKTTSSTDANGTTIERKTSTKVDVDEYGNKNAVVKSKTTRDPKGLLNKSTTSKTTQTIEEKQ